MELERMKKILTWMTYGMNYNRCYSIKTHSKDHHYLHKPINRFDEEVWYFEKLGHRVDGPACSVKGFVPKWFIMGVFVGDIYDDIL